MMIHRLGALALLLPALALAAPRSANMAQKARDLSVKAETTPSAAATFAWATAADAYQTWLAQYGNLEGAGRMQYGYATALAGSGQPLSALEQYEGVMARDEGIPEEMRYHCVRASLALADETAETQPEDAATLREGQVRLVARFGELHPEHEALAGFRVAAGEALMALGRPADAAPVLQAALDGTAAPEVAEPASAALLTALTDAKQWDALVAAVAACADHAGLGGAIAQQRCQEVGARAGWERARAMSDAEPAERGAAMLAFAQSNPGSEHRAEALVEAASLLDATAPADARRARLLWLDDHPLSAGADAVARAVAVSFENEQAWGDAAEWWGFLARYHGGEAGIDEALWLASSQAVEGAPEQAAQGLGTYLEVWPKGKRKGKAKKLLRKLEKSK